MTYGVSNDNFIKDLLEQSKQVELIKSKRGEYHYYTNLNLSFEFLTTDINKENKCCSLPYLLGVGLYKKQELDNAVYYFRDKKDILKILIDLRNCILIGLGNRFCNTLRVPIYVKDLNGILLVLNEPEIKPVFKVKGKIAYAIYDIFEFRCLKVYDNIIADNRFEGRLSIDDAIRTPETILNEEYNIVKNRLLELNKIIDIESQQYEGKIPLIDLTRPGIIKDKIRSYCRNRYSISSFYKDMPIINSIEEYKNLSHLPGGGICAYNKKYIDETLEDVYCFDFTSYYPSVMYYSDGFPHKLVDIKSNISIDEYLDLIKKFAVVGTLQFQNLKVKDGYPAYLKNENIQTNSINTLYNNDDNLVSADYASVYCTEHDFKVIKNFYNFDKVKIDLVYIYEKGRLPKCLVQIMLKFYENKAKLHGCDLNELYLYNMSKVAVNICYGLLLVDPCRSYANVKDKRELDEFKQIQQINKYNENILNNKGLSCYHWGIYVAAIARGLLSDIIAKAIKLGVWIYSDTDSCYFFYNKELFKHIEAFNKMRIIEGLKLRKYFNGKFNYIVENEKTGEESFLGIFEFKEKYKYMKVLGKKKYITSDGEKIKCHVAGLISNEAEKYLNDFGTIEDCVDAFNYKTIIPKGKRSLLKLKENSFNLIDKDGNTYKVETTKNDYAFISEPYKLGRF